MAKVIFVNPNHKECGVYQYGMNLFNILLSSKKHVAICQEMGDWDGLRELVNIWKPDCMIWNWSPLIAGPLSAGPPTMCKNILVQHECHEMDFRYDRILSPDPTGKDDYRTIHIGRPLPFWMSWQEHKNQRLTVGLHGFGGAWAAQMATQIASTHDVSQMKFRMRLPPNKYVDPDGSVAKLHSALVWNILIPRGAMVDISHEYSDTYDLLDWLAQNDINCYVRDKVPWFGVSSALDAALAVNKPIAINRCEAFRHMFDCQPSICLEDHSLTEIIQNSDASLAPKREAWRQTKVREQVEKVIDELL